MLVDEVELLLLIGLPLEQLPKDSQAEAPMGERRQAGFFQGVAGVAVGEADQALQHANPFNPAVFEHRFGESGWSAVRSSAPCATATRLHAPRR